MPDRKFPTLDEILNVRYFPDAYWMVLSSRSCRIGNLVYFHAFPKNGMKQGLSPQQSLIHTRPLATGNNLGVVINSASQVWVEVDGGYHSCRPRTAALDMFPWVYIRQKRGLRNVNRSSCSPYHFSCLTPECTRPSAHRIGVRGL